MRYRLCLFTVAMLVCRTCLALQVSLDVNTPPSAANASPQLGKLGMDVELLHTIRNRRPLLAGERECFYSMLAAAGRAKPFELERAAFEELQLQQAIQKYSGQPRRILTDVVPLFNDPDSQAGRLVMIEGDARRAVEIRVDNPEIMQKFNIKKYYEIAVFTDDSQGNPLICCVLHVPADMPLGEDIVAPVRVAGFFFKSWAYPRGNANGTHAQEQLAPLVIGREARLLKQTNSSTDTTIHLLVVGIVLMIGIGIVWAAWRTGRSSRTDASNLPPPRPDFSGLE